jgi:hypothetical protein
MYTFLWVPPALLFLFSLWGFLVNFRGFVLELRYTIFPARHLFWMGMCLVGMIAGSVAIVWLINLMEYRNEYPTPIEGEPYT